MYQLRPSSTVRAELALRKIKNVITDSQYIYMIPGDPSVRAKML
jgi:hypothetical protein